MDLFCADLLYVDLVLVNLVCVDLVNFDLICVDIVYVDLVYVDIDILSPIDRHRLPILWLLHLTFELKSNPDLVIVSASEQALFDAK